MSVMTKMRSGTDSSFMQIVMGAIVVSFVAWGVAPQGDQTQVVVVVNGEQISDIEYNRAYRNMEYQARQRTGGALSEEERDALRQRVRESLIQQAVLDQEATKLGLEVSDTEIATQILGIQGFADADGKFSDRIYRSYLQRVGLSSSDFEEQMREDLRRDKLNQLVFMGATVSEPLVRDAFVEANTTIDMEYVRIRPSAFYEGIEVSAEEAATFASENAEAVQSAYDKDYERLYHVPEKLEVRMIKFGLSGDGIGVAKLRPKLEGLVEQIAAGADFAEIASRYSEDSSAVEGGSLGVRTLAQLGDEVAGALADLPDGEISDVLVTPTELRVFRIDQRFPEEITPLADLSADIATTLIREKRGPVVAAEFAEQQLLTAWTEAAAPPAELLAAKGLETKTTGPIPLGGSASSLFKPPPEMMKAAGKAAQGDVLPGVYEDEGVLWVGQVKERVDADLSSFDEEKDELAESALRERRSQFFSGWVDDLVARATIE